MVEGVICKGGRRCHDACVAIRLDFLVERRIYPGETRRGAAL